MFTFGSGSFGGTVYRLYSQSKDDMSQLGVGAVATSVTKTLTEIHLHSVNTAVAIITQCRILDRQKLTHSQKSHLRRPPPIKPALQGGLTGSVGLPADSVTNA